MYVTIVRYPWHDGVLSMFVPLVATDKSIDRVGTIDDSYYEVAANGSLSVVGDGTLADVIVNIQAIRIA